MAGCSLSLMRLDGARLARLDAPTQAPAWPAVAQGRPALGRVVAAPTTESPPRVPGRNGDATLTEAVHAVTAALREAEARLTALDQAVGDGDLGTSLARGAAAIERDLPGYDLADPASLLRALSGTVRRTVGGSSGPFYAVFLLRAASVLDRLGRPSPTDWADAFLAGCDAIAELGGAGRGDRTMLDALYPAAEAFHAALPRGIAQALDSSVAAGREGAARAAGLAPRRGRSSYLGQRVIGQPDPGAEAVVVWLAALRRALA
jgi:dihydroxyacetone kinase